MTHSLPIFSDYSAYEKKEKCGLFAIFGTPDAARITHAGLLAQQHRGQESAGIAVWNRREIVGHNAMGLVTQIFNPSILMHDLAGHAAIGHVRYSTTGSSELCNAQPLLRHFLRGPIAVAHNGNLINAIELRRALEARGHVFHSTTDTEVILHLLTDPDSVQKHDPLPHALQQLAGAFSLVFLFPNRIEAARDPWGVRPLSIGRIGEAPNSIWIIASETCAFDAVGAMFVRDVEPGEIVRIDESGISSRRFAIPAQRGARCVFEHVYFANPASNVFGQHVHRIRESLGRQLARESLVDDAGRKIEVDCIMPMPESGRSAALGFSMQSGVAFEEGIVLNPLVGRIFILPDQSARDQMIGQKFNVIGELVKNRRIAVVDDSIVRGTTMRAVMQSLRAAGAKEIHLRISSPPIRHACYYGIDFADPTELITHHRSVTEIAEFLGVDSLQYLSLKGMLACIDVPEPDCCTACWTGHYKIQKNSIASQSLERDAIEIV